MIDMVGVLCQSPNSLLIVDDCRRIPSAYAEGQNNRIKGPSRTEEDVASNRKERRPKSRSAVEILLKEGALMYKEEGPKCMRRLLSRQNKEELSN